MVIQKWTFKKISSSIFLKRPIFPQRKNEISSDDDASKLNIKEYFFDDQFSK